VIAIAQVSTRHTGVEKKLCDPYQM